MTAAPRVVVENVPLRAFYERMYETNSACRKYKGIDLQSGGFSRLRSRRLHIAESRPE
jgi:hypothetical protein